jgi:DNA-binding GntR family transcriptional regulator
MSSQTVSGTSLVESVKSSLIRSSLENGESLTEAALCKRFKVSRGAIRDVLAQLESQGLIERKKKKGTSLRTPTLKEIIDFWDIRSALEGVAARLAAAKIQPKDLERLTALVAKREDAFKRGDVKLVDQYDIDFHQIIIDVGDNGCVRDIVRNMHLFDRLFRFPMSSYSVYDEQQDYSHLSIIEALRSGDPDRCEDLIKRHIQAAKKKRIEALIGKVNLFE